MNKANKYLNFLITGLFPLLILLCRMSVAEGSNGRETWVKGDLRRLDSLTYVYATHFFPDVPWSWDNIASLRIHESAGDYINAVSYVGAAGLMQLMPETGAEMGLKTPDEFFIPEKNLYSGIRYLYLLYRRKFMRYYWKTQEDRMMAAFMCYNAGTGHVIDAAVISRNKNGLPLTYPQMLEDYRYLVRGNNKRKYRLRYGYVSDRSYREAINYNRHIHHIYRKRIQFRQRYSFEHLNQYKKGRSQ